MIYMLCEIMKQKGSTTEIDPDFVGDVISRGHYWALGWQYNGLFQNHFDSPAQVRLVADILTMWSDIEFAIQKLTPEELSSLKKIERIVSISFIGFDGNEETDYLCIAELMLGKMKRFQNLKESSNGLNSHFRTMDTHKAMLNKYKKVKPQITGRVLALDELVQILSY